MRAAGTPSTLILLLLGAASTGAQTPVPIGSEFQVNTYVTGGQGGADISTNPNGSFIVIWSGPEIEARRFDASGTPIGNQFQVNTYATDAQYFAAVAADPNGNFVVVWNSQGSPGTDSDYTSIQGQRFDSVGTPVGQQFQVNTYTTDYQFYPDIDVKTNGEFIIVWESYESPSTPFPYTIQAQRYEATGNMIGLEFQVSTYTLPDSFRPTVGFDGDGEFVVAWDSFGSAGTDGATYSVQARRFSSQGVGLGAEFQVNTYTTHHQGFSSLAVSANGDFVVAWMSQYQDGWFEGVFGQRYDASGTPSGAEFPINSYTFESQSWPSVAADSEGNFVVVWQSRASEGTDSADRSVQGQLFDARGRPIGAQFQVNTYTTGHQHFPAVAMDIAGDFVVVWSGPEIHGQRFGRQVIFSDGFESGDTSAWSSTLP